MTVLSVPLSGYKNRKQKLHGIISKKINTFGKRKRIAWEALTIQCLEGLHKVYNTTYFIISINLYNFIPRYFKNSKITVLLTQQLLFLFLIHQDFTLL